MHAQARQQQITRPALGPALPSEERRLHQHARTRPDVATGGASQGQARPGEGPIAPRGFPVGPAEGQVTDLDGQADRDRVGSARRRPAEDRVRAADPGGGAHAIDRPSLRIAPRPWARLETCVGGGIPGEHDRRGPGGTQAEQETEQRTHARRTHHRAAPTKAPRFPGAEAPSEAEVNPGPGLLLAHGELVVTAAGLAPAGHELIERHRADLLAEIVGAGLQACLDLAPDHGIRTREP